MKAIFYDRKNKREVSSSELMEINLVQTFVTVDSDDLMVPTGRRICPSGGERMDFIQFKDALESGCFDRFPDWYSWEEEKNPIALHQTDKCIGSLGYKSNICGKYQNWDLWCNIEDLVLLRFEEEK
jgi:hypothetical protein